MWIVELAIPRHAWSWWNNWLKFICYVVSDEIIKVHLFQFFAWMCGLFVTLTSLFLLRIFMMPPSFIQCHLLVGILWKGLKSVRFQLSLTFFIFSPQLALGTITNLHFLIILKRCLLQFLFLSLEGKRKWWLLALDF